MTKLLIGIWLTGLTFLVIRLLFLVDDLADEIARLRSGK